MRQRFVRHGRELRAAFMQPAALTLCIWGFASGLSALLIGSTLSIWLRGAGWSLSAISRLSLVGLLYALKFLWAPYLDRWRPPGLGGALGQRRGWLVLLQLALLALLLGLSSLGPQQSMGFSLLVLLTAWAGASQDILIDAYRIEIAPREGQGALAATYGLGYRIGMLFGGALTLYIAEFFSWRGAYLAMAALLLLPLAATLLARDTAAAVSRADAAGVGASSPYRDFFHRYGWRGGALLLAFVGLFKLPDQLVSVIGGPFYLDSGFSPADIATVSKFYAVWVSVAGAFVGGLLVAAWAMRRALLLAALLLALSNLGYLLLSLYPGQLWAFVVAISGDYLAQGLAGVVLVAFMSELTDRRHTAAQYAFLSSLAFMPGRLLGGFSGDLAQALGYPGFFVLSTCSILPTLWLLARLWSWLAPGSTVSLPQRNG